MSGRVKLNITESTETLKTFRATKQQVGRKEYKHYLLKTKQVETVQHLAVVLGRNRVTVQGG